MREILFKCNKIHEGDIVELSLNAQKMTYGCKYGIVKYEDEKFIILIINDKIQRCFQCSLEFGLGHVV